jgi:ATP-dependent RNA helicase RhlE
MPVDRHRKRELLSFLIRSGRIDRALVFARTKHGTQRLAEQLERDGIRATAIHGDRSQGQRIKALDDFKEGRVDILVATEVAARGLDIDGLPHVVNFELPTVPEDYVHRIGRTGRAGMQGDAVSLVCIDELDLLNDIEALLRVRIPDELVPGFELDRSLKPERIKEVRRAPSGSGGSAGRGRARSAGAPRRQDTGPRRTPSRAGNGRSDHGRSAHGRSSDGRAGTRVIASRPVDGNGSHVVMPGERLARNAGA